VAALSSNFYKFFPSFPKLSYKWCYWMVMSHVIADYLISPWKVTFFWPLSIHPGSLNGILDHVGTYATLAREAQVVLICLFTYLLFRTLNAAANYLYKLLQPA